MRQAPLRILSVLVTFVGIEPSVWTSEPPCQSAASHVAADGQVLQQTLQILHDSHDYAAIVQLVDAVRQQDPHLLQPTGSASLWEYYGRTPAP
eukprot:scaffold149_cov315-Pinguiococcus_pyrenoidosus.AAC.74